LRLFCVRGQQGRHWRPVCLAAAHGCARRRGATGGSRDRDPATVAGGASRRGAVADAYHRRARRAIHGEWVSALSEVVPVPRFEWRWGGEGLAFAVVEAHPDSALDGERLPA